MLHSRAATRYDGDGKPQRPTRRPAVGPWRDSPFHCPAVPVGAAAFTRRVDDDMLHPQLFACLTVNEDGRRHDAARKASRALARIHSAASADGYRGVFAQNPDDDYRRWAQEQNLPEWAGQHLQRIAPGLVPAVSTNPFFLTGDFDGNAAQDIAVLVLRRAGPAVPEGTAVAALSEEVGLAAATALYTSSARQLAGPGILST